MNSLVSDANEDKAIPVNAGIKYAMQKGRASRKTSRDKKMYGTPQGEPWIWLSTELLLSCAW